jgi:hypothetical protein
MSPQVLLALSLVPLIPGLILICFIVNARQVRADLAAERSARVVERAQDIAAAAARRTEDIAAAGSRRAEDIAAAGSRRAEDVAAAETRHREVLRHASRHVLLTQHVVLVNEIDDL